MALRTMCSIPAMQEAFTCSLLERQQGRTLADFAMSTAMMDICISRRKFVSVNAMGLIGRMIRRIHVEVMMLNVFRPCHHLKIIYSIVSFVSVDMVYNLMR